MSILKKIRNNIIQEMLETYCKDRSNFLRPNITCEDPKVQKIAQTLLDHYFEKYAGLLREVWGDNAAGIDSRVKVSWDGDEVILEKSDA